MLDLDIPLSPPVSFVPCSSVLQGRPQLRLHVPKVLPSAPSVLRATACDSLCLQHTDSAYALDSAHSSILSR